VHLAYPRTTRDSRIQSLFGAFAAAAGLRILGLAGVNMATKGPAGLLIVWGVPVIGMLIAATMIHYQIRPPSLPAIPLNPFRRRRAAEQSG
jgi:hypothetical protein